MKSNLHLPRALGPPRAIGPTAAFTLVELIGVVAVIFVLALAVLPAMLRQLDDLERSYEESALASLAGGLRSYVLATRTVPGTNTIATDLANQLGWTVAAVQTNGRGVRRFFIPDPDTRIGTNRTLPYIQTNIPAVSLPTNQPTNRFMIVSTLRSVLPPSVFPGCSTNAVAFKNAWEGADGARPTGWSDGDWSDIMIQRVDLKRLYTQVILNSTALTNGKFSLDDTNNHRSLPRIPFTAHLLQGTELGLHTNTGALQFRQIVQGAGGLTNRAPFYPGPSFVFEKGTWRGKLFLTTASQQRNGMDLQGAYEIFMSGPLRANAGSVTQSTLTWNFYNFMSNYVYWASTTGGSSFAAAKKAAVTNSFNSIKSDLSYYCK